MQTAATIFLILLGLLSVFQIALALGAPLGQFAWGGQHKVLPKKLRIGSVIAVAIYAIYAVFIASKSGIWQLIDDGLLLNIMLWVIAVHIGLSVVTNFISRSKPERYTMTPISVVLLICVLVVLSA